MCLKYGGYDEMFVKCVLCKKTVLNGTNFGTMWVWGNE